MNQSLLCHGFSIQFACLCQLVSKPWLLYIVRDALEKVWLESHDLVVMHHVTAAPGPLQSGPLTSHSQLFHRHVRFRVQLSILLC